MRMPRYDVRNDGVGPYAVFYCDKCYREYRSQPDIQNTITKDVGRAALGGLLRNIPVVGYSVANNVLEDPRYVTSLKPDQLEAAWQQVQENFHECPTCRLIVCPTDWDPQAGFCTEDSPRRAEIAQAQAEQAAGVVKGFAAAFGLGQAVNNLSQAARAAAARTAHCSQCGTLGAPGTKFCPKCGGAMIQPEPVAAVTCPTCQAAVPPGSAFCTNCGAKVAAAAPAAAPQPTTCPTCGAQVAGRFCGACGTKVS
jgi:double zinc ribbon protein